VYTYILVLEQQVQEIGFKHFLNLYTYYKHVTPGTQRCAISDQHIKSQLQSVKDKCTKYRL